MRQKCPLFLFCLILVQEALARARGQEKEIKWTQNRKRSQITNISRLYSTNKRSQKFHKKTSRNDQQIERSGRI